MYWTLSQRRFLRPAALCGGLSMLLAFTAGCDKVSPDPNDQTPPQIEIKVRDASGQYVEASKVDLHSNEPLEIMCIVSDSGGIKTASLEFFGKVDSCTVGGAIYTGTYYASPLPSPIHQSFEVDSDGTVLERMPLLSTLDGAVACSVPGIGTGRPYGTSIKIVCGGRNWASAPQFQYAQKALEVVVR